MSTWPRGRAAPPGTREPGAGLAPQTAQPARRRREWRVEMLGSFAELDRLAPAWTELFHASETRNPFAHPVWLRTWARHSVAPSDLRVVAVWSGESLVAVAPFFQSHRGLGPARVSRLRLLGGSNADVLTELVEVLALPDARRRALRMILEHLHSNVPGWDWIELGISPQQAWLEPDIVAPEHGSSVMHFYSDASVEVPLPGTIAELDGQLKRNVTESIRRARNRLARDGREWSVTELTDGPDLDAAFGDLRRLHRARAHMDVRSRHPDRMATPQREAFVREAVSGLAVVGAASIFLMRVDARAAAVVLSLRAHESTFVSISGYDPALWDYGVMTLLTQEVLHSGVARGHSVVDLSLGPDNAKLRWSEHVAIHPYFAVVRRGPRARLAFRAFLHARAQLPKVLANQPPGAYAGPHARGIAGGEAAGAPEHE